MAFIIISVILIILAILVFLIKRAIECNRATEKQMDNITSEVKKKIKKEKDIKSPHKCSYCGGNIPAGVNNCPNCGATNK